MGENIIRFPKAKLETAPPETAQEAEERIVEYRTWFAEDISESLFEYVVGEIDRATGNVEGNQAQLEASMVLAQQSILSLFLMTQGVFHPLQAVAEEYFEDSGKRIEVGFEEE